MKYTGLEIYGQKGRLCLLLLGLFIMLLSGAGCGKKAPPVLPALDPLGPAENLTYILDNNRVCLNWTFSQDDRSLKLFGFTVYLSRTAAHEEPCEECPILFTRVADVSADTRTYCGPAARGFRYKYKVVGYTENGNTSPDSNIVSFEY